MNNPTESYSWLPDLDGERPVPNEIKDSYRRNGHALVRGLASADEVAAYRNVITAAVLRFNEEQRPLAERDTYGKAFLQIMNLWRRDAGVRRFTLARRFACVAAELMGVDGVRIYHDQALYKEPGGGPTPFHQDQYYWPLDTANTITMWMPLVRVTEEVGSMTFATASHRLGYIANLPISDKSEAEFRRFIAEHGLVTHSYGAMAAGDATFHSGWTLHGAGGNPTGEMREVMTIIYMAAEARVIEPDNPNRVADLETWLPGLKPGDIAASELNPVVWSK